VSRQGALVGRADLGMVGRWPWDLKRDWATASTRSMRMR